MNIRILQLVEGARQARGLTVIIDVFRAFTVEAWLSHNHAASILPVGDVQAALAYRSTHPGAKNATSRNTSENTRLLKMPMPSTRRMPL